MIIMPLGTSSDAAHAIWMHRDNAWCIVDSITHKTFDPSVTWATCAVNAITRALASTDDIAQLNSVCCAWPPEMIINQHASLGLDASSHAVLDALRASVSASVLGTLISACGHHAIGMLALPGASYCQRVYRHHRKFLSSFAQPTFSAKIARQHAMSEQSPVIKPMLESLATPSRCAISYGSLQTKTGRVSAVTGYNIAVLRRAQRNVMVSQFSDGVIIAIDIRALEPTVAAALAQNSMRDVYDVISNDMHVSRAVAKQITLSTMFGSSLDSLCAMLVSIDASTDRNDVLRCMEHVMVLLNIRNIAARCVDMFNANAGMLVSALERPLWPGTCASNVLYNNYVQSVAADVSLIAFSSVLAGLSASCIPIALVHDCVYVDVEQHAVRTLLAKLSEGVNVIVDKHDASPGINVAISFKHEIVL